VKTKEKFIDALVNGEMFDSLFGYAHKRCYSREESEDLCQEIVTEILATLDDDAEITDKITDDENMAKIKRSIKSLSTIYRDVIVMHYFDELKISEIATRLNIPENRVKQRLFSAKEKIRKEVTIMPNVSNTRNTPKTVKEYTLSLPGTPGSKSVFDEHSRETADTALRQNIIIACRSEAKSIKTLSEELKVPESFLEDEARRISSDLLKNDNGKYIANSIVVTPEMSAAIDKMMSESAADHITAIKEYFLSKKDEVMAYEYLNAPRSYEFLLWYLIPKLTHSLTFPLSDAILKKMEANNIKKEDRGFYLVPLMTERGKPFLQKGTNDNGVIVRDHETGKQTALYNIGVDPHMPWHKGRFPCITDFTNHQDVFMILKTIGGLDESKIDESQKEAAATALEKEYIRRESAKLYPNPVIATLATEEKLNDILWNSPEIESIASKFTAQFSSKYWEIITAHVPPHLLGQADIFVVITAGSIAHYLIEQSLSTNLLAKISPTSCAEGILGVVEI